MLNVKKISFLFYVQIKPVKSYVTLKIKMNLALAKYYSAANAITFSIILAALFVTRKIIVFTNKSKLFKLATKNVSNVIKLIK